MPSTWRAVFCLRFSRKAKVSFLRSASPGISPAERMYRSEMAYLIDQFESLPSPISLRRELSHRALALAASEKLLHETTDGEIPSIIFGRDESCRHGNFHA